MTEPELPRSGGFVLLARKIVDSEIFARKPAIWFKIWVYILLKVNYADGSWLKRGQGHFNWSEVRAALKGTTRDQWVSCLKWLKWAQQITTQRTQRGMIITVLNYDAYQQGMNYKSTTETTAETTIQPQQDHNRTTTLKSVRSKEVNKSNKYIGDSEPLARATTPTPFDGSSSTPEPDKLVLTPTPEPGPMQATHLDDQGKYDPQKFEHIRRGAMDPETTKRLIREAKAKLGGPRKPKDENTYTKKGPITIPPEAQQELDRIRMEQDQIDKDQEQDQEPVDNTDADVVQSETAEEDVSNVPF